MFSPARDQLRDLLGDNVVDRLTDAQAGRVLGAVYATARREIERFDFPGQLELVQGEHERSGSFSAAYSFVPRG